MNDKDLAKLNQPEVYSIICESLYALKDCPKYSIISELAYLLDEKSFIKFVKYFGGTTLKVPTVDELKDTIKLLLLYQAVEIDGMPWKKAIEEAGFDTEQSRSAQRKLSILKKTILDFKLGGHTYD